MKLQALQEATSHTNPTKRNIRSFKKFLVDLVGGESIGGNATQYEFVVPGALFEPEKICKILSNKFGTSTTREVPSRGFPEETFTTWAWDVPFGEIHIEDPEQFDYQGNSGDLHIKFFHEKGQ